MIQRLYRLLLLFCSIAVFAACSDSDGNDNNGGNGGEIVPDGGDTYGYVTGATATPFRGLSSATTSCTQTDAEGQYVLTRNAKSGFVFYSLPSGYKVNMHKTYKLPKPHQTQTGNRPLRLHADGAGRSRNPVRSDLHRRPPDQRGGARRPVQAQATRTSGYSSSAASRATPSASATW
ncbi:MAG: metallophosphoesterase N-terminal domain-containing protein [Alistipes onderdonkii]